MKDIQYQMICFSSLFYQALIDLRQKVLRTPLGRNLEFDQTRTDPADWHIGAVDKAHLIGVVSLSPKTTATIQMRQMAIDPPYQGRGIGKELVKKAEHTILKMGYKSIQLDARESAVHFYEKMDYRTASGSFYKTGIPHYRMAKSLEPEAIGSE
jgi:predicted GNAT family N-acyltransferase